MFRVVSALFAVLFLTACGGGSGPFTVDPGSTRSLTGLQPPGFSDSAIVPTVNRVLTGADAILVSDVVVGQGEHADIFYTYCDSASICETDLGDGGLLLWDARDLRDGGLDPSLEYTGVGEKHGVSLVQAQGRSEFSGIPVSSSSYGAWLGHSAFLVEFERITSGVIGGIDLTGLTTGYALSIGDHSGARPTGNAVWRGIMVGGTADTVDDIDVIQGDATLVYDIARNDLDVAFTNVYNLDQRRRFRDLRWLDLYVDADGSFHRLTATREIHGRFYGPGQREVGGIFTHPEAIGAFGARR